jgi:pimeloyl-ACP methyl ester carboxylesterase
MAGLSAALGAVVVAAALVTAPAPPPQALRWHDCHTADTPARLECATLAVPLDWSDPDGPTITLALDRLAATDPAHRIGPLLVNPGGPGGSGVDVVSYGGMLLGSPELRGLQSRFDLVGFDPRGVGHSTPVRCPLPLYDPAVSPFPASRAGYARLVAANRRAGAACARSTGELIAHVDTRSAARDVDAIRRALGVPAISWLGVSYGTELGAVYAELYPNRVRAMVLDGAVDHSRSTARAAVDEARAIEAAFHRFAAWCRAAPDCALRGDDIVAGFDALIARADRGEITDPHLGRPVTAVELTSATYQYLTFTPFWPALASALAAAEARPGDPSALLEFTSFRFPFYPAYRAVGCHDFAPEVRGPADLRARAARIRSVAPHLWRYSEFWDFTSGCLGWPVRPANPPQRQHVVGAPPILVVGTTHDPATPYAWAVELARHLDGSRLLTHDGDGHTALDHSACARTVEAAYLVTGTPPPRGTVCRDRGQP